jgi:SAM-dependent methyltransferase
MTSRTNTQALPRGIAPWSGTPLVSSWTTGWLERLPVGLSLLDWASGDGRHALWAQARGFRVSAWDINAKDIAFLRSKGVDAKVLDLELQPLLRVGSKDDRFDCIVVNNYLYRRRWANLLDFLKPTGVLIYETFAQGQERFGRPSRSDFLLAPGELIDRCQQARMQIVAYEDGLVEKTSVSGQSVASLNRVQRVCAIGPHKSLQSMLL